MTLLGAGSDHEGKKPAGRGGRAAHPAGAHLGSSCILRTVSWLDLCRVPPDYWTFKWKWTPAPRSSLQSCQRWAASQLGAGGNPVMGFTGTWVFSLCFVSLAPLSLLICLSTQLKTGFLLSLSSSLQFSLRVGCPGQEEPSNALQQPRTHPPPPPLPPRVKKPRFRSWCGHVWGPRG